MKRKIGCRPVLPVLAILALVPLIQACGASVSARVPARASVSADEVKGIPPGHMPPPGSCRVWFPGEPPGHQPPPGDCDELLRAVPSGAWLLHRPSERRRVYRIG